MSNPAWGHTHSSTHQCLQDQPAKTQGRPGGWQAGSKQTPAKPGRDSQLHSMPAPRMKTSPRMRWPRAGPACWRRQQRRAEEARRRKQWQEAEEGAAEGGRPRGEGELSPRTSAPGNPATCLTVFISSVCRLAQEEVAPAPLHPQLHLASAATPAPAAGPPEEVGPRRGVHTAGV